MPSQLLQMRGVFSVLGLDQAAQTVQRMRENVDQLLAERSRRPTRSSAFDSLGNNLGALGFLIDMLSYQPALAKRLFVFDAELGELKPLMGRQASEASLPEAVAPVSFASASGPVAVTDTVLSVEEVDAQIAAKLAALAGAGHAARRRLRRSRSSAAPPPAGPPRSPARRRWRRCPTPKSTELEEDDLQNIFLDEAREVLHNGLAAVSALASRPDDGGELTVLRRAFHTLKGSSRMVGLMDFGEAAWSFEQVLNTWLADQRPATPELLARHAHVAAGLREVGRGHRRRRAAQLAVGAFPRRGRGLAHR